MDKMEKEFIGKRTRYIYLDIIKFIMAIIIVIYHYNYFCENYENAYMFRGGYLAVEVFFVISGFLFFLLEIEFQNMREKSIILCMKHKISGLWPAYIVSLIMAFGIHIATNIKDMSIVDFLKGCFWFVGDALMISEWGIPKVKPTYNIIIWYISAMLLAFIIWLILFKLVKNKKYWIYMILLLTIGLYGYIGFMSGNLHVHGNRTHLLLNDGVLRGIAGIGAGFLSYYTYKSLRDIARIKKYSILLISLLGLFSVLLLSKDSFADFIVVPCAVLVVAGAALLQSDKTNKKLENISSFLGTFSYYIYLNHLILLDIMKLIMKEFSILLYLFVVLIVSFVIMKFITCIVRKIRNK